MQACGATEAAFAELPKQHLEDATLSKSSGYGGFASLVSVIAALTLLVCSPWQAIAQPSLHRAATPQRKFRNGGYDTGYSTDGARIYFAGSIVYGADPTTFRLLDFSNGSWAADSNYVYLDGQPIVGADPASFQVIKRDFSKDASHVFKGVQLIGDADAQTFAVLDGGFEKDAYHVYYGTTVLPGADPRTFTIIRANEGAKNETVFAKDATHVFYEGGWALQPMAIQGADPATFEVLDHDSYSGGYAKDSHAVYWGSGVVKGANPSTFVDMAPYGKDDHAVYLGRAVYGSGDLGGGATVIEGADPSTFQIVDRAAAQNNGDGYTKDATHVYFEGRLVSGADAPTFEVTWGRNPDIDAKDKSHTYFGGRMVE